MTWRSCSLVLTQALRYFCAMSEDFSRFFKPGCVHRQLYTDPAVFEMEMARIFGQAWIYIGHESQVKKPGDYFATQIGRHPAVMTRDAERSEEHTSELPSIAYLV